MTSSARESEQAGGVALASQGPSRRPQWANALPVDTRQHLAALVASHRGYFIGVVRRAASTVGVLVAADEFEAATPGLHISDALDADKRGQLLAAVHDTCCVGVPLLAGETFPADPVDDWHDHWREAIAPAYDAEQTAPKPRDDAGAVRGAQSRQAASCGPAAVDQDTAESLRYVEATRSALAFAALRRRLDELEPAELPLLDRMVAQVGGELSDVGADASDSVSRTQFTTGTLSYELSTGEFKLSAQTIRNAMQAAGLTANARGDAAPRLGPREVSLIATAREQIGFKRGERQAWEWLLKRMGAPGIGDKVQAKPKTNPKAGD